MASSSTEICNLALSHLGNGKTISNIDTERSAEALACRAFYETARDVTLRDANWPFATAFRALGLIETDPTTEWTYSYRYPTDCLKLRRFLSGIRNDNRQSRTPYRIARDDAGRIILTDLVDANVEYTFKETSVIRFPSDFVMALSFRLAAYIAPRVTGGDAFKMGERALRLYTFELGKADSSAASEVQDEELPDSEFIRTRE